MRELTSASWRPTMSLSRSRVGAGTSGHGACGVGCCGFITIRSAISVSCPRISVDQPGAALVSLERRQAGHLVPRPPQVAHAVHQVVGLAVLNTAALVPLVDPVFRLEALKRRENLHLAERQGLPAGDQPGFQFVVGVDESEAERSVLDL